MMGAIGRRTTALVLAAMCVLTLAAFAAPAAYADGSAGVVVEHGDGSIDTYCVAFQGDGISGTQLLAKAGISEVSWNGSVCAIGNDANEGCFQPHDYSSCYCKSYPPTNTYWAFFTQKNDEGWIYSPLGVQSAVAHNGDLQAWRWGVGGPQSAPPPPAISFAQVCAASVPATATPTTVPATATATATLTTTRPGTVATAVPTITPLGTGVRASATPKAAASATATAAAARTAATNTPAITNHGSATATAARPPTSDAGSGSSGTASLAAFAGVAALLLAAIAGAVIYRRRHGH